MAGGISKKLFISASIFIAATIVLYSSGSFLLNQMQSPMSGAPPYGTAQEESPPARVLDWIAGWSRPNEGLRVGLQVGHWKSQELPEELAKIRNNTGASGGGKSEWEVNYAIAQELALMLRTRGITVDILPATVPPGYWADVFIAIHADGNENAQKRGFKIARPWRDFTRKADILVDVLQSAYRSETGLDVDPNITRNMRGYYAFGWWRFNHAIHPMTTAVIVETGFLTNAGDRTIIVDQPERSASGLYNGLMRYFELVELDVLIEE